MADNTTQELIVKTTAGILKAVPSTDPDRPGICIMLIPDGYDTEIDVAMAEVFQGSEDEQGPFDHDNKDIHVVNWLDATTEDWTNDGVIAREDIEKGLTDY